MVNLVIFHYHTRPGGVTDVILLSLKALLQKWKKQFTFRIVTGSADNIDTVQAKVETFIKESGRTVSWDIDIVPEVGYLDFHVQYGREQSKKITKLLMERYHGAIWWIHNYHIGKNPLFTQAVLDIAHTHTEQKIFFHIHDFPEAGRPTNFQFLQQYLTIPPYPVLPNVHYLLINQRDRQALIQAGIPEKHVSLIQNPIETDQPPPEISYSMENCRRILMDAAEAPYVKGEYDPQGARVFYPVRTIRRKNVLEAALILNLLNNLDTVNHNLIVTLPGTSDQEADYSNAVARIFDEKLTCGLWNVGTFLDIHKVSFTRLITTADVIISTSVQEGFGYLFINALQWQVPLFARYLDTLNGWGKLFSQGPTFFYSSVKVPAKLLNIRRLKEKYREAFRAIYGQLPLNTGKYILTSVLSSLDDKLIDFSSLGVPEQIKIIEQSRHPAIGPELARANQDICLELKKIVDASKGERSTLKGGHSPITDNDSTASVQTRIRNMFGYAAFAAGFDLIVSKILGHNHNGHTQHRHGLQNQSRVAVTDKDPIPKNILKFFSKPEYVRLLYLSRETI